ncbi:helix-turn-helix domain-containing protein [Catenovulum sediminis]|uniref:helix-turn-helix domain-containing protein n=1 Tax=Catenovulum sediminis TaxID=1740262 RepID=UPI00117E6121|nr:helix-turn-helix domain-containing protein [Catenovulum sediminis]
MSSATLLHLPTSDEIDVAKRSSRTLAKYASVDRVQMSIRGSNGEGEQFVLPGHVMQILLDVLSEISNGNAISLIPHNQEVSTQEAANILNVSRPFLIKLLEGGNIPFHKIGTHRRVKLQDILTYKQQIDEKRNQALDELSELSQSEGMGY